MHFFAFRHIDTKFAVTWKYWHCSYETDENIQFYSQFLIIKTHSRIDTWRFQSQQWDGCRFLHQLGIDIIRLIISTLSAVSKKDQLSPLHTSLLLLKRSASELCVLSYICKNKGFFKPVGHTHGSNAQDELGDYIDDALWQHSCSSCTKFDKHECKIIINDLNQTNPGIDAYGSAKNLDVCLEMPAVEHVAPCFSEGSLLWAAISNPPLNSAFQLHTCKVLWLYLVDRKTVWKRKAEAGDASEIW